MRDMIARQVRRLGWEVEVASNGAEALSLIERKRPALILLDLVMPEMDGFELTRHLHNDPDLNTIPVIILTAMELNEAERASLQSAVDRILHKGMWSSRDLLQELQRLLPVNGHGRSSEGSQSS
jgi:CheY-like chemotaxis protein